MNLIYKGIRTLVLFTTILLAGQSVLQAQIFESEGLNMPGQWNGFTNPPEANSVFGSATQVNGGLTLITTGQRRWQTSIHIAESNADTSAGTYSWLFTSGPTNNPYANKWAGVNVVMNTIQSYSFNTGADNVISLENDRYYTFNWEDIGYFSTRAIVMPTTSAPVNFVSLNYLPLNPTSSEGCQVQVDLDAIPSNDQFIYVRYSLDNFATSSILLMTVNGTTASAEIPALSNGTDVSFYVFSTSIENPTADFDLQTLRFINDDGLNFSYSVSDPTLTVNLGDDIQLCPGSDAVTIDAGAGFDTYLWSTGDQTQTILVDAPGQYTVEVSSNSLIARDTLNVSFSQIPAISLGQDIVQCGNEPVLLSPGVTLASSGNLLTIIYDATQGQSGLIGATSVYMHSTFELNPFGGPNQPWVGNWGQDDGLGQMTSLGNDLWSITIDPFQYYAIPQGTTSISGLFMVFRNADGSAEGKDDSGNDIFINLQGETPTSSFSGVSTFFISGGYFSILWSTGETSETIEVTESGTYSVVVTTTDGCEYTDDIQVEFNEFVAPVLPEPTFVCGSGQVVSLDAGPGYTSYLWSTGEESSSIDVTSTGSYSVTVIDINGCEGSSSTSVTFTGTLGFHLGNDTTLCGLGSLTLSSGLAISSAGDSLTIRYDASQGIGDLEGANKVYMHSGLAFQAQGAWNNVVGNWGQDDGIGEMQQVGETIWTITINPYTYFGIPVGSTFQGIWMVFRNADGTALGKNEANQDIYLNASAYPSMSSGFSGLTASVQQGLDAEFTWSTGDITPELEVSTSGIYWLEVSQGDCFYSDTIQVTFIELPELNLSNDTVFCGQVQDLVLSANEGFESYSWSTGETSNSITVQTAGTYTLTALASGCSVTDSVRVINNIAQANVNLGPDKVICGLASVPLNPGVAPSPQGDMLTIVYDASQGQSGLSGASSVYMHSSFEYAPFQGAVEPWVGNWGQDDGLGEMTSLGNDLWSITMNVYNYYGIDPDSSVNGLFIVFRNADGSATGKDENGNDIFLDLQSSPVSSSFAGISAEVEVSPFSSLLWSTGETTSSITINQPGTYSVTLFGTAGCNAVDTIQVTTAPLPTVDLGPNQVLCDNETTVLDAGPGYSSYLWSNGATSQTITTSLSGNYTVSVTTAQGCEGLDVIGLTQNSSPQAAFAWLETGGLNVDFSYTGSGTGQFFWDFNGDGNTDNTQVGNATYTFPALGQYTARLIVTNACGSDTAYVSISLIGLGIDAATQMQLQVFPNPAKNQLTVQSAQAMERIRILDFAGRVIQEIDVQGEHSNLDVSHLANGIYFIQVMNALEVSSTLRFVKN